MRIYEVHVSSTPDVVATTGANGNAAGSQSAGTPPRRKIPEQRNQCRLLFFVYEANPG